MRSEITGREFFNRLWRIAAQKHGSGGQAIPTSHASGEPLGGVHAMQDIFILPVHADSG
jgi:hypothetical protein